MTDGDAPDRETLKTAIGSEGNERIECPVCGDEIPAFELATDHAHARELLELIANLLPEETDGERLREGYEKHADRNPWMEDDEPDDSIG